MNMFRATALIPSTKRCLVRSVFLFQSHDLSTTTTSGRTRTSSSSSTSTTARKQPYRKAKPSPPIPDQDNPRGFRNAVPAMSPITEAKPEASKVAWPRPAEIPWQPKVANSVHLIGRVAIPVQLDVAPDGRYWAVSVLRQQKTVDLPDLWIPVVFEADLAQIAACYLKVNDLVYVTGQISGEQQPFTIEQTQTSTQAQASIQVMVNDLSYVQRSWMMKEPLDQAELTSSPDQPASYDLGNTTKKKESEGNICNATKTAEGEEYLWQDLLNNPKNWWDNREVKKKGLIKRTYPDFKQKATGKALWLDKAPKFIISQLQKLKCDEPVPNQKSEVTKYYSGEDSPTEKETENSNLRDKSCYEDKGRSTEHYKGVNNTMKEGRKQSKIPYKPSEGKKDDLWRDLVENPANWWDNRLDKLNPKGPDFKHKVTGEGLWISVKSTPAWVYPKLPPTEPKKGINVSQKA